KKHNVYFFSDRADVLKISRQKNTNLEEQARLLRYDFFNKCKDKFNLDKIATAHNKNDLVETFLINLIRGSSLDGLTSLKSSRQFYIRPILCIEKSRILNYLHKNNLEYKTDITNFDTSYKRNKIRLELLETLKSYNPNILSTLFREVELLSNDRDFLNKVAYENYLKAAFFYEGKAIINTEILSTNYSIKSRVLKMAVSKITNDFYSLSFQNINRLIETIDLGKILVLRKRFKAYKINNLLIIEKI
ncbi:MAG: tRNA lysidine(34) synthetase TilS, partial [Desulfurella sp.]